MQKEQLPKIYYRDDQFVMVQKAQEGFGPGSIVCVDANEDGLFEFETVVGQDGIWNMAFAFLPTRTNKQGQPFGEISMFMQSADSAAKSEPITFLAIQESMENPAKEIPVDCVEQISDAPNAGMGFSTEANICTCAECPTGDTLLGSSLDGFTGSLTPNESGVETATGKYRNAYQITTFDTRMLNFDLHLYHASMVKYDGPIGQSFSHSYNMMIVQNDDLTGQIVTPDLRIYDIESEDGLNWYLPEGFYSRLCRVPESNRWILTHHTGLEIAFYQANRNCPRSVVMSCK